MRIIALTALAGLALAAPMAARAQDPGALPADLAQRVTEILNDADTRRYEGDAEIESGAEVQGDVAVLDGDLSLSGRVEGDVVVVNGSLQLGGGAEITGDVIVVGGDIAGQDEAEVAGEMVVFAEPVSHCRRGDLVDVSGDCSGLAAVEDEGVEIGIATERGDGGWEVEEDDGRGNAQFVVAAGRSYNRVEGLPIKFGPAVETGGSNPLRVRALAVFRTEEGGELGAERWGYDARIEQFFGGRRAVRVGGRAFSVVDPIEAWHLTDLENSLSTFFLHQDFRDHFHRRGWTAFATLAPRGSPLSATVEYREERHRSVAPGSPWALFKNDDPWRPQPLVGEGRLNSVAGIVEIDSRSEQRDPASGWYVRGEVEQALRSTLTRPEAASEGGTSVVPAERFDGRWIQGSIDIRRYNRISPSSRLNLRLAGGASINGDALPPQRQHALGGEGTLPGFPLFALDCGARVSPVSRGGGAEGNFYPRYGCDGFALFQAEYRGDVSFRVDLGGWGEDEDEEYANADGEWVDESGIDADFGWVFFMDAGRGWTGLGGYDEPTAVDLGAGVIVGDLGIYFAVPVGSDRDRGGLNFFVRLAPRFLILLARLSLLWMTALLLATPAAAQQRRPLTVTVGGPQAQWRPVVRVGGLLRDRALREALQNGLPLRVQFRVELWRKADPFDQLAGVQQISRALLRAPLGEGYTLEDGRVQRRYTTMEAAEAALQAALQPTVRPESGGRFYYLVRLNVETLSESDMDELRHWLRGEARPAVAGRQPVGRAVERGVRRFFVRLLGLPTRRYEARTPIFAVR